LDSNVLRACYSGSVKILTVRLPDLLVAEIERESQTRGVSKSDVVRERLHMCSPAADPLDGNMDEALAGILKASWAAKVPAGRPRFRSAKKQKIAEVLRAKKLHR
jgi:Arc/MetJ-type ribon-helix-helix transcriptional regulator